MREDEEEEDEEASWEPLGALLGGFLGASWEALGSLQGASGGSLGGSLAIVGRSWPVWRRRKPSWDLLLAYLGPSWGASGPSWRPSWASWRPLAGLSGRLGPS